MHDDPKLPDDLEPIAARLHAARHEPDPVAFDDLRRRALGAAPARRGAGSARRSLTGALLALGLMLTGGTTMVLASGAVTSSNGGYSSTQSSSTNAAACQYGDNYDQSQTVTQKKTSGSSQAVMTATYDCETRTVCVESDKEISNYTFQGQSKVETRGGIYEVCAEIPEGATSFTVTVKSGTTTYTYTFTLNPPD
jgi:hypothetical protein